MAVKFTNNASATLASSITNVATSISVTAGQGALFPSLSGADYFYATLVDASNNLEIVKVTARSTDALTVVRGQDGTTARAYTAGDKLELRPVAAAMNELVAQSTAASTSTAGIVQLSSAVNSTSTTLAATASAVKTAYDLASSADTSAVKTTGTQTIAGLKTFSSQVKVTSDGTSVMSLSTFAGTSGYSIEQGWDDTGLFWNVASTVRGVRWIKNGSSNLAIIDSSGNFTALGNVTAYSDERLKKNWTSLQPGFVDLLANVKSGVYERIDEDMKQVGVSAQSLQEVLPEAVHEDIDGMLSVSYGSAALASAIELAKEVVELKKRLEVLEAK